MPKEHKVKVIIENGEHRCDPTETHVDGGDTVLWGGSANIKFVDSPFEEGGGPFPPQSRSTVKRGLRKGAKFSGIAVKGQIIVDNP
jgi:hypothetical protein